MTARTHDAFAFASLVTVAAFYPPGSLNLMTLVVAVVAADIGSLMPDMDQAGNRLWDLFPAGDTVGKVFRRIFYKHRTLSHSLVGLLLIYKFFDWFLIKILNPEFINPEVILVSIMVGIVSHLLADSLTKEGLPLFFPLKFSVGFPPIEVLRIRTGKWIENLIIYPGAWVYLIIFIYLNQERLVGVLRLVN